MNKKRNQLRLDACVLGHKVSEFYRTCKPESGSYGGKWKKSPPSCFHIASRLVLDILEDAVEVRDLQLWRSKYSLGRFEEESKLNEEIKGCGVPTLTFSGVTKMKLISPLSLFILTWFDVKQI